MNKYRKLGVIVCIFTALTLAGCGQVKVPDVVDVSTIAITEEGTVTSYLVDIFDQEYYDISELASMAITEAAEYNTEKQSGETVPVTVDKVEALEDGSQKVVVTHKYDSADTFMDYNDSVLFYGTVQEAVNEGYNLNVVLKSIKDDSVLSEEDLIQDGERHLVITKEKARIYCPEKVTHISEGAVVDSDGSVDTTQTESTVVILMKK